LVSQATFSLKLEFHRIAVFRVNPLERELMEKIAVLGRQNNFSGGLTVDDDLRRAANVRRAFSVARSNARSAMIVACVVPQVPAASFFDAI